MTVHHGNTIETGKATGATIHEAITALKSQQRLGGYVIDNTREAYPSFAYTLETSGRAQHGWGDYEIVPSSGDLYSEYNARNAERANHSNGTPWTADEVKTSSDALYAQWESAVIAEMEAQGNQRQEGQQWGGHVTPEGFRARHTAAPPEPTPAALEGGAQ